MSEKITVFNIFVRMKENWPEAATNETAVMLGLIRLKDIVDESLARITTNFGLTPTAFEVLVTLRALPAPRQLTPTDLYRSILISSGGMTKVLNQLEKKGCIRRLINNDDQRSKLVRLTEKGAELVERSMMALAENDKKILFKSMHSKQITQLKSILLGALEKIEKTNN